MAESGVPSFDEFPPWIDPPEPPKPPVKDILDEAFPQEPDPPPLVLKGIKPKPVEPAPVAKKKEPYTVGAEHQGPRRHAVIEIRVDGRTITTKLNPYLISVQVIDTSEGGHTECHIELDDRNGELQIPPDGVTLTVAIGWAGTGPRVIDQGRTSTVLSEDGKVEMGQGELPMPSTTAKEAPWGGPGLKQVFSGKVSSVESGFGRRGGGRRLWIEATGGNVKGLGKEIQSGSWGEGKKTDGPAGADGGSGSSGTGAVGGTAGGGSSGPVSLETVMTDVFKKAGIQFKASPEMAKITRNYWAIENESPQSFGMRIAKDVGGIFKMENGIATIVERNSNTNADEDPMPIIEATWGVNLIGWRVKPYAGRPQWGAASSKHFDPFKGEWTYEKTPVPGDNTFFSGTNAVAHLIFASTNSGEATASNKGTETESTSRRATGWVLINGEPEAHSGGKIRLIDARPGVDGTYQITEAEHNYQRGVGYTTRCNVSSPTPNYGTESWLRDPGKGQTQIKTPEDPYRFLSEEEKLAMREHFISRGWEIPPGLQQTTVPNLSDYRVRNPTGR